VPDLTADTMTLLTMIIGACAVTFITIPALAWIVAKVIELLKETTLRF